MLIYNPKKRSPNKAVFVLIFALFLIIPCITHADSTLITDNDPYGVEAGDTNKTTRLSRRETNRPQNGIIPPISFPQVIYKGVGTSVDLTDDGDTFLLPSYGYAAHVDHKPSGDIDIQFSQSVISLASGTTSGICAPNEGVIAESTITNDTGSAMLLSSIYIARSYYQQTFFPGGGINYNVDDIYGSFWDQQYYHYMLWLQPIKISVLLPVPSGDPTGTETINGVLYREVKLLSADGKEWVFMSEVDDYHEAWYGMTDKAKWDSVMNDPLQDPLNNYTTATFDPANGGSTPIIEADATFIVRWGWYFGYNELTVPPNTDTNPNWAGNNMQQNMGFRSLFGVILTPFETLPENGSLKVSKLLDGNNTEADREFNFKVLFSDNGTYGGYTSGNVFSLKGGESKTILDIPQGIGFEVYEEDVSEDGYIITATGNNGTIVSREESEVIFTNTRNIIIPDNGSLTVKKVLSGNDTQDDWEFTFKVVFSDGGTHGGFASGGTFTLKGGDSKTISDIPPGIQYTVTEEDANQNGYTTSATGATGTIASNVESEAVFTNIRNIVLPENGILTVKKVLSGNNTEPNREFTFKIVFSDGGTYGGFASGSTFTLKGDESKTISDIPSDIQYTVTEEDANQNGYTTTSTGATGTITSNIESEAVFTNTRHTVLPENGSLTVKKVLSGNNTESDREFTFKVVFSDGGTYGGFASGSTFTLQGGENKTISDIPSGIQYTVTEEDANQNGYTTTSTGATGTIASNIEAEAVFTNTRHTVLPENGSLTVKKVLSGNNTEADREFTFKVVFSDGGTYGGFASGSTFTLKGNEGKTISDIPPDIQYTVTEEDANQNGYTTTSTGAAGTIASNIEAEAVFTNTRNTVLPENGSLKVSKLLDGNNTEADREFTFKVIFSNGGTYGGFASGSTFTLKGGESKTISDIPSGIQYTVTEENANQNGYTTSATGATGTIDSGEESEAVFTNTRNTTTPPDTYTANISIIKNISGTTSTNVVFTFDLVQVNDDGSIYDEGITASNTTTGSIAQASGQVVSFEISNLEPQETYYFKITERNGSAARWTYSNTSHLVTVTVDAEGEVVISYPEGSSASRPPIFLNTYTPGNSGNNGGRDPRPDPDPKPDPDPDPDPGETEIPDPDVPIGGQEDPVIEIPDNLPPLDKLPQTGHSDYFTMHLMLLALSLAGLGLTFISRKKLVK